MSRRVPIVREGNMVGGEAPPTWETPLHAPPPDFANFVQYGGLAMSTPIVMYVQTPNVSIGTNRR